MSCGHTQLSISKKKTGLVSAIVEVVVYILLAVLGKLAVLLLIEFFECARNNLNERRAGSINNHSTEYLIPTVSYNG